MISQNYFFKIFVLFVATFTGIFAIWYSLIRAESADWITSQIVHQASPYAVTTADNGEIIIGNALAGYEFKLPLGFKTNGARNLSFYLEDGGVKKCEIRHQAKNLVFELADQKEKNDCGKYLSEIKNSLAVD